MTTLQEESGYDKAKAQIDQQQAARRGFILYTDSGERHCIHMHDVSSLDCAQMITSLFKNHPNVKILVDAFAAAAGRD